MKISALPRIEIDAPGKQRSGDESATRVNGSVSVIIVTCNSIPHLGDVLNRVLPSLSVQDEIVVVDRGSTDGTAEIVRGAIQSSSQFKSILSTKDAGFAESLNRALRMSRGEFIVLLRPEAVVTPGWLSALKKYFDDPDVGAVGPVTQMARGLQRVEHHAPHGLNGNFGIEQFAALLAERSAGQTVEAQALDFGCLMVRRIALDKLNGFDESLPRAVQDLDFSWRLSLLNFRMLIARDVFVHGPEHPENETSEADGDCLARKLIDHYGVGAVPLPQALWGGSPFHPSNAMASSAFAGADLSGANFSGADLSGADSWGKDVSGNAGSRSTVEPRLGTTLSSLVSKLAHDYQVRSIVEIGSTRRLVPSVGGAKHVGVPVSYLPLPPDLISDALVVCERRQIPDDQWISLARNAKVTVITGDALCADVPADVPVLFEGEMPCLRDQGDSKLPRDGVDRKRLWILDRRASMLRDPAPAEFRPVSLMTTFNDVDVIDRVIDHTLAQGLQICILDNWSTDGTYERLLARRKDLASLERFPLEGPSPTFDLFQICTRQEEMALRHCGQWVTLQASDELRVSPWPGVSMREALYFVDRCNANCVDFTVAEFRPVDNSYKAGDDLQRAFSFFEFGLQEACLVQQKTWKQPGVRVQIAATGGHSVQFAGKNLFPYKFLLKHYSIRSQAHGEAKVFGQRKNRWNREEKERLGWHTHYDRMNPGHSFLYDPSDLRLYDEETFWRQYLVERTTGIGTVRGIDWWGGTSSAA